MVDRARLAEARRHTQSLQFRLAALISLVLVAVTTVIGAVTITIQHDDLVRRVDDQLRISAAQILSPSPQLQLNLGSNGPESTERDPVGPRFGSLSLATVDGVVVTGEVVNQQGETISLTDEQTAALLEHLQDQEQPSTAHLPGLGSYRVISGTLTSHGSTVVLMVGKSLAEANQTTRSSIIVFALAGLTGVVVASLGSALMVRRALRPLEELRKTAAAISETPLASGSVTLPERMDRDAYAQGSEVGDLAESFNQMVDHVEAALVQREESERKLKQFVADASHELRTPLATVGGYAEFAQRQEDTLPEDVARSLSRIRSESGRMATMVEDLLLLARVDSQAAAVEGEALVAPVVLDCVSDAQVTGPGKTWRVTLPENASELRVQIRPEVLKQILVNLLANARLHTPDGTEVTVTVQPPRAGNVTIEVEDNGPGVPKDLQSRVFDRFTRADPARSPLAEGASRSTGLGLAITRSLAESSGGTIDLDSVPGRTVFSVRLPEAS